MFAYEGYQVPDISNYAQALAAYEKARRWRGDPDGERKMGSSDNRHHGIRKTENGTIALRLHRTDLVQWHPDGSFSLDPYASISSDNFLRKPLPHTVRPWFNHHSRHRGSEHLLACSDSTHSGVYWWRNGNEQPTSRIYQLNSQTTKRRRFFLDREGLWQPDEDAVMAWETPRVNVKRAAKARAETGLNDLIPWLSAAWQLRRSHDYDNEQYTAMRPWQVYDIVCDRSRWMSFIRDRHFHRDLDGRWTRNWGNEPVSDRSDPRWVRGCILRAVQMAKHAVYKQHGCYDTIERLYLGSIHEVKNHEKALSAYGVR